MPHAKDHCAFEYRITVLTSQLFPEERNRSSYFLQQTKQNKIIPACSFKLARCQEHLSFLKIQWVSNLRTCSSFDSEFRLSLPSVMCEQLKLRLEPPSLHEYLFEMHQLWAEQRLMLVVLITPLSVQIKLPLHEIYWCNVWYGKLFLRAGEVVNHCPEIDYQLCLWHLCSSILHCDSIFDLKMDVYSFTAFDSLWLMRSCT